LLPTLASISASEAEYACSALFIFLLV
jgi:hypothetical protein